MCSNISVIIYYNIVVCNIEKLVINSVYTKERTSEHSLFSAEIRRKFLWFDDSQFIVVKRFFNSIFGDIMKRNTIISIISILSVLFLFTSAVGCSGNKNNPDVPDFVTEIEKSIKSSKDIENLVTSDDKLVINYYDAYSWVVFFDELGHIRCMTYIYNFSDDDEADIMANPRKAELERNRTMTVYSSRAIDEYVVVILTDTSFTNITRSILENNFSGLVVY